MVKYVQKLLHLYIYSSLLLCNNVNTVCINTNFLCTSVPALKTMQGLKVTHWLTKKGNLCHLLDLCTRNASVRHSHFNRLIYHVTFAINKFLCTSVPALNIHSRVLILSRFIRLTSVHKRFFLKSCKVWKSHIGSLKKLTFITCYIYVCWMQVYGSHTSTDSYPMWALQSTNEQTYVHSCKI